MKPILIVLLLTLGRAQAQQFITVSGQVSDATSGAGLFGAAVTVLEWANTGVSTDPDGRFVLKLAAGKHTLQVSYLGYSRHRISLSLSRDEVLNIRLKATGNQLNEVIVSGQSNQDKVMSTQTSRFNPFSFYIYFARL